MAYIHCMYNRIPLHLRKPYKSTSNRGVARGGGGGGKFKKKKKKNKKFLNRKNKAF